MVDVIKEEVNNWNALTVHVIREEVIIDEATPRETLSVENPALLPSNSRLIHKLDVKREDA